MPHSNGDPHDGHYDPITLTKERKCIIWYLDKSQDPYFRGIEEDWDDVPCNRLYSEDYAVYDFDPDNDHPDDSFKGESREVGKRESEIS